MHAFSAQRDEEKERHEVRREEINTKEQRTYEWIHTHVAYPDTASPVSGSSR